MKLKMKLEFQFYYLNLIISQSMSYVIYEFKNYKLNF